MAGGGYNRSTGSGWGSEPGLHSRSVCVLPLETHLPVVLAQRACVLKAFRRLVLLQVGDPDGRLQPVLAGDKDSPSRTELAFRRAGRCCVVARDDGEKATVRRMGQAPVVLIPCVGVHYLEQLGRIRKRSLLSEAARLAPPVNASLDLSEGGQCGGLQD